MQHLYETVSTILGQEIFQNSNVVDVGCARFAESKAIQALGAKVTALDVCHRENPPEGIVFVKKDFLQWEPATHIDMLYMSNVALFIPTDNLFLKIAKLQPQTIAVRTMYDYPNPNWPAEELQTLYFTLPNSWTDNFEPLGYSTKHAKAYTIEVKDMRGRERLFSFTEYIGKK